MQGSDPLVHQRVNSNTWRLSWGAISKPTPARRQLTLGNSRVVEGPAPLKELGSRAQAMRGGEPDYLCPAGIGSSRPPPRLLPQTTLHRPLMDLPAGGEPTGRRAHVAISGLSPAGSHVGKDPATRRSPASPNPRPGSRVGPRYPSTGASQLSPVLGHLYNLSLSQEKVPMLWKNVLLGSSPQEVEAIRPGRLQTSRPPHEGPGDTGFSPAETTGGRRCLHSHYGSGGEVVEEVEDYKYLGVVIDNRLDWKSNTEALYKKGMSRLYFLRKLRSFNVGSRMVLKFLKFFLIRFEGLRTEDVTSVQIVKPSRGKRCL
ncbi:hypothetical protein L3Q82_000394 [Scortum barcoo]|uniref:Uncharacterized protein n=1 Tax=Scortum barcoo TaxID=214431 RepID=A0ACB8X9V2_9TELE|nr:hypothetical protein L3Q82_000394 [Scortum barcoo]